MIQVNKFQVGNYILDYEADSKSSIYYKVEEVKKLQSVELLNSDLGVSYRDGSLWTSNPEPVPLTEEILLKCGSWDIANGLICYSLVYDEVLCSWLFYVYSIEGRRINCGLINYLHQLQNLYFALTQEELEISL